MKLIRGVLKFEYETLLLIPLLLLQCAARLLSSPSLHLTTNIENPSRIYSNNYFYINRFIPGRTFLALNPHFPLKYKELLYLLI